MRVILATTLLLGCAAAPGCYLNSDGQRLEQRLESLEDRHSEFVETFRAERARLSEVVQRAEQQVQSLEATLTNARDMLARNSADLGADVEELRQVIQQLSGQLGEAEARYGELRERLDMLEQLVESAL